MNLQFAICNFSSFYELTCCVSTHQKDKTDKKIANCKFQFSILLTATCCVSTYCRNIICEKNCKFNQPYKHTLYFVTLHREKFTKRTKPSRRHLETISKEYRTMLSEKTSQNNNCRLTAHGSSRFLLIAGRKPVKGLPLLQFQAFLHWKVQPRKSKEAS